MKPVPLAPKSPNYLIIIYLVKKFIQHLKSCISVKRLLAVTPYHLNILNDRTAFYKDGKELASNNSKINDSVVDMKSRKSFAYNFVKFLYFII